MTHPAVAQDLLAALAAFTPVCHDVERQDGTELFDRQGIVPADAGKLRDQDPRAWRYLDARLLGDEVAGRPTSAGLGSRCGVTSTFASASCSVFDRK